MSESIPRLKTPGQYLANGQYTVFDQSWLRRSQDCIAQGALTNSKRPECFVPPVYPTHLKMGRGCHVWDVNGKKYVDYICGLGSNLIGYANAQVTEEIIKAANTGAVLSLGSDLEVIFAEKIKEMYPWVDCIKALKTGTEACMAAVRIARAATGRQIVLSEGYHGHLDEFIAMTPPALGVNRLSQVSQLVAIEQINNDTAAVIVEPIMVDNSDSRIQWLRALRKRCTEVGALLICDEIINGLRYLRHGATNYHGIEPDLLCLGKAVGGGMPLSVVAGKKEVMNCGEYFVSSTFAGDRVSMAAGLKALTLLQTKFLIEELWQKGSKFLDGFNALWPEMIKIEGYPTRGVFKGNDLVKALLWQESCKAGILFGSSWFFNFMHPEHTEMVLNTCSDIVTRIKTNSIKIEGALPQSPFSQKQRS